MANEEDGLEQLSKPELISIINKLIATVTDLKETVVNSTTKFDKLSTKVDKLTEVSKENKILAEKIDAKFEEFKKQHEVTGNSGTKTLEIFIFH